MQKINNDFFRKRMQKSREHHGSWYVDINGTYSTIQIAGLGKNFIPQTFSATRCMLYYVI